MQKRLEELKSIIENKEEIDNIFIKSRDRRVVDARTLFYNYAKNLMGYSLVKISRFTNQHYATVLYSLNKFKDLMEFDKDFRRSWDKVVKEMKALDHVRKQKDSENTVKAYKKDNIYEIKDRAFNKIYSKLKVQERIVDDSLDDFLSRDTRGIVSEDQLKVMFETAKKEYHTLSYIMGLIEKDNKL